MIAPSGTVTVDVIAERLRASDIEARVVGVGATRVAGITHDSRAVESGQVFACLRGESFDGHEFAEGAVADGAVALLVDHEVPQLETIPQIVVDDTRVAVGPASAAAWGDPSERLITIGITGTNGKTTTAQLLHALLEAAGHPTGIIGTLHGPRTTPEAPDLHSTLSRFVDEGKTAVVMEVSSHALALHRIDGTGFDVVAFTNFGHDHLDLHGSPEAYFRAKSALFTSTFAPVAVINVDDAHGSLLADTLSDRTGAEEMRVVTIDSTDLRDVEVGVAAHDYRWRDRDVHVALGGGFNVLNSQMALSIIDELDVDMDAALVGLEEFGSVPGRFELVETPETIRRGFSVVVDYAHTPDGLERVLADASEIAERRTIAVFGCAGRRDREKRPLMGAIAARLADVAIATSDNPRGEDPDEIIGDVLSGVPDEYRARVLPITDRRRAIHHALTVAESGDVVVIAGKGHETTQDLGSETIEFDDRRIVSEELNDIVHDEPKDTP
ncbi:UDP-N-acetylmuramoyl-L-alanyl-D-glutamate--2,6-diaminopimelate ligase [Ilumatobacter nonamiensis]|uniref:UDP-N-acetylmuramoyl-L-alanyl-D-glutamate--2, 6-diaminopimelate ligase n=1 Tax=Ilumatobacter nonamiensis TaxID=467093 RepID=UPI0003481C6D|nr:UDP-N-acetylmuramoyl-L-alanyl-D-glutamate--2,6-diaminopimelate ligase [Ilumatobacter nonamiensis]